MTNILSQLPVSYDDLYAELESLKTNISVTLVARERLLKYPPPHETTKFHYDQIMEIGLQALVVHYYLSKGTLCSTPEELVIYSDTLLPEENPAPLDKLLDLFQNDDLDELTRSDAQVFLSIYWTCSDLPEDFMINDRVEPVG